MVVNTHKFAHTKSYEPRHIVERDKAHKYVANPSKSVLVHHMYSKIASLWYTGIKAKADFMIADMDKSSFKVVEMKKSVKRVGVRQIPSYLRMPVVAGGLYIFPLERDVARGGIFAHGGVETLPELVKVARPIEISSLNQELVETLLGSQGKSVLEQVLSVIKDLARGMGWPLDRVEIRYVRDPEVKDWEYVLLLLVFTCDFDTADRHLHELYNQIDMLTGELSDKGQEVLRRMIFFDIETKATISSD